MKSRMQDINTLAFHTPVRRRAELYTRESFDAERRSRLARAHVMQGLKPLRTSLIRWRAESVLAAELMDLSKLSLFESCDEIVAKVAAAQRYFGVRGRPSLPQIAGLRTFHHEIVEACLDDAPWEDKRVVVVGDARLCFRLAPMVFEDTQ